MTAPLKLISFYVDEPTPGKYRWVLHERTADGWTDIRACEQTCDTWADAWSSGHLTFLRLLEDRKVGPRAIENEDADPVG